MSKSRKIKIGIAAGITVISAVVTITTRGGKKSKGGMSVGWEASVTVVKAERPSTGDIIPTTGLTGTMEPSDVVHIYAKAAGGIMAVYAEAGDMMAQRQALLEINIEQVGTAKNSMDSTSVSLLEIQSSLKGIQTPYNSDGLPEQEYEQYVDAARPAQPQYESARLAYERQTQYSFIAAPINGGTENPDMEVYDRMSRSQDLCAIVGEGENVIPFYVIRRMMQNTNMDGELETQKNEATYKAYINEISSMIDTDTGLLKIKAQIEDTQGITPGSTVKLNLMIERALGTMVVPVDVIYYSGGNAYVYLHQDGITSTAQVEVGLEDEEYARILSGLLANDMVVSIWSSNLYEGAKIRLRDEAQSEEVAAPDEEHSKNAKSQTGQEA